MITKTFQHFARPILAGAIAVAGILLAQRASAGDAPQSTPGESASGAALALDGKDSFVRVADSPSFHTISGALTVEARFLAHSFYPTRGSVNSILRKNVRAGAENFFLRIRNLNGPHLIEFGLGPLGLLQAAVELETNQWYHLAGVYDGSTAAVYLNGVQIKSQAVSGALSIDNSDLVIGKGDPDFSYGEFFHGMLDEIRIWDVARSASQLRAGMNSPLSGMEKGLAAYWSFDGGTAKDLSGHSNDGHLAGTAETVGAPTPALAPVKLQPGSTAPTGRKELTKEKRLEVAEALWRNLSEIYPALEYKGIRGREWFEPALACAREAKTDQEFYTGLVEQMARLKDTHTRIIFYPGQPSLASPPVMLNQVEGKVAVIRADPSTTLVPGDIIVSIEQRPAEECVAERIKFVCGSTERARVRGACEDLLRGPPDSTVSITVQGAEGAIRVVELRRENKPAFWREPALAARPLEDGIGYIRIARWTDDTIPDQFDLALENFKDARGLIIDVRGNGGGSDHLADVVNGRLITKPVVSSIDFWRKQGSGEYDRTIGWVQPRGPWTYEGRVAVLIDEASTSACEHFVSGIEATGRILLVGTPTNGAGGGPTAVELPDGTRVRISRALGVRANGIVFEGHGIPPHIYSPPTLKDLRERRDGAFEAAKDWINSGKPLPPRCQGI